MVSKRIWLGMLAAVLVFGMTVVGCGEEKNDDDSTSGEGKSIKITGINASGANLAQVIIATDSGSVAMGMGQISSGSTTIALLKEDETAWTGSGSYFIQLMVGNNNDDSGGSLYLYTNSQTLQQLQITNLQSDLAKFPKFNFTETTSTIPFDKFADATDLME